MNTNTRPRKKSGAKATDRKIGLIVLLIIIVSIVVVVAFMSSRLITAGTSFVEIPLVQTTLRAADGTSHNLGTRVALEVEGNSNRHSGDFLQREVRAAISTLSYDDITSFHGMDMLRQVVQDRLEPYFNEGELVGIYFTEVLSGMPMPSRQVDEPRRNNTVFDAIFGPR